MSGRPCRTTWFGWTAIALAMACWSGDDADTLAPGVPTLVTAVPGAGSVALWWQDPADTDLAGIRITYEPGGGALDVAPGAGTASFDGLADGTEYTFLLVARDAAGHESPGIAVRAIPGNVIGRTAPRRLHVVVALTIANTGQDLTQMSIVFPYVPRNPYQDVGAITLEPGGEVLDVPDSENRYVRYLVTGSDLPLAGETRTWSYEFDVTLYTVVADLAAVTGPYDYDATTELYARYTGDSGVWVVPGHPTIRSVSDTLWSESTDLPDYARRCYDYVATSFTYAAPHGHESLDDILAAGTGDCGCLSAVFVSLLRARGIPARHLVSRMPDSGHAWADFYLERYGWIPVDVTFHMHGADTFGKPTYEGVILSYDQVHEVTAWEGNTNVLDVLQSAYLWYLTHGGDGTIERTYSITYTALP